MTVIESTVLIQRPPEEVFDYLSDPRNELEWNPKVRVMEKLTERSLGSAGREIIISDYDEEPEMLESDVRQV